MKMIIITKEDLEEINKLISKFVIKMKDETTSVPALGFCLQSLIEAKEKLEEELRVEDDDE